MAMLPLTLHEDKKECQCILCLPSMPIGKLIRESKRSVPIKPNNRSTLAECALQLFAAHSHEGGRHPADRRGGAGLQVEPGAHRRATVLPLPPRFG